MRPGRLCFFFAGLVVASGCSCNSRPATDAGPRDGGVGAGCSVDSHCRDRLVCDPVSSTCQPPGDGVEGDVCELTGDCAEGLYCGPGRTCVPAGEGQDGADCGSTADCVPGLVCTVEGFGFRCRAAGTGDLGAACNSDLDCIAGLRCSPGSAGALSCLNPPVFDGDGGVGGMLPPVLPGWPGVSCEVDESTPTAYFRIRRGDDSDRDFFRLPFPNDILRSGTGIDLSGFPTPGTALPIDVLGRHIEASETNMEGFATNPVVYFRFSRPFDWDDVTGDSLWLVDITPSSPDYGGNVGRAWLTTAGQITRYICPNWLAIRRGHGSPLRPGTTYAAILMTGIRTSVEEGSVQFQRSSDLNTLLLDAVPADEPLASAHARYQPLRDWLTETDLLDQTQVLNAAVFTTQDTTAIIPATREAIRAATAPVVSDVTVCDTGIASPCDDGGARQCSPANDDYWEIHARIGLPRFQQGTPPYENPEDGGGFATDGSGRPSVVATEQVCMLMTIPKVSSAPPMGFPVVFYGHGTGGAFTAPVGNGLATDFANGGPRAITVAVDMPLHGSRRNGSTRSPDGLVFNFANPRAARDNFLQGAADLMALVYWAESYVMPSADAPTDFDVRFDPSRMVIFGHSQGATHAQLMVPFEPGIIAALLSGAGGDLTESLLTKTRPVNIAGAVPLALLDVASNGTLIAGDYHPALALLQMFYERADPVNYGILYHAEPVDMMGHHVFQTYGLGDSFSTERTMSAFARSARMPHVAPELVAIGGLGTILSPPVMGNVTIATVPYTVGLRQYMPDSGNDGHFVSTQTAQGRMDAVRFLNEALAGVVPSIGN